MNDRGQMFLFAVPVLGLVVLAVRFGGAIGGLDSLLPPVLILAATFAAVVFGMRRLRWGVPGHSHGGTRTRVARHEAAHAAAARAVGGRVLSARASASGGRVEWDMSDRSLEDEVRANVTFLRAGEYADPVGCGGDRAAVQAQLRRLPSRDRGRVRAAGESHARRIVASRAGEIRRDAARLNERGSL